MGVIVKAGATLTCPFAIGTSTLITSAQASSVTSGAPVATINDCSPITNIPPFPACTSQSNPAVAAATAAAFGVPTPAPCMPVIAGTWTAEKTNVSLGGSVCLTAGCQLSCGYGGVIQIASPGQTKVNL
ncbi:MAG: DUF4280 domain-containing protein [Lachnospiraceae bacterium]|nr:DUF4280 domain-containing protein [Lachnospiraceae bacterium]